MGYKDYMERLYKDVAEAEATLELHEAIFGIDDQYKAMWESYQRTLLGQYLNATRPKHKEE